MNPALIALIVQLAPMGIDFIHGLISAYSRDELDAMSYDDVKVLIDRLRSNVDAADARRKAALA